MRRHWVLLLFLVLAACSESNDTFGSAPRGDGRTELPEADLRVVFLGNSLTYTHDVPGLVRAMADAAGLSMSHVEITRPNASLEDHWHAGAPAELLVLRPDVVVMQQGPSSLPENQAHLAHWSSRLAEVIRQAGGEPALYMIWPPASRRFAFEDVWTAYHDAAETVEGMFIPAGRTWLEAWAIDDGIALYGPDDFHPSYVGALAAAQTIFAILFERGADEVPALDDGLGAEMRGVLSTALDASLLRAEGTGVGAGSPSPDSP